MNIPEEHIFYDDPEDLFYGNIDLSIQDLIWEINQTDWMRSICSCSGHPNSEDISEWSNGAITITVCIKKDSMEKFQEWKHLIYEDTPKRYKNREMLTRMGRFISGKQRKIHSEIYGEKETDKYKNIKLKYNVKTIGERNSMIELMREALREVES